MYHDFHDWFSGDQGLHTWHAFIHAYELQPVCAHCEVESCVEDSKLYMSFSNKSIDSVMEDLKSDQMHLASWCCTNWLLTNPSKTRFCVFGSSQMLKKLKCHTCTLYHRSCLYNSLPLWVQLRIWESEHISPILKDKTLPLILEIIIWYLRDAVLTLSMLRMRLADFTASLKVRWFYSSMGAASRTNGLTTSKITQKLCAP